MTLFPHFKEVPNIKWGWLKSNGLILTYNKGFVLTHGRQISGLFKSPIYPMVSWSYLVVGMVDFEIGYICNGLAELSGVWDG